MKTEHFNFKDSWGGEFQTELGREIIKEMKRLFLDIMMPDRKDIIDEIFPQL